MIGIIGAMDEEIRILKDRMKHLEEIETYSYKFYRGIIQNKEVVLAKSGIGKINASITLTLMKMLFDIKLIINTGSAGALDPALTVGDVLIAHSLSFHDVDVQAFGYVYGQMAGMPEYYYPDIEAMRIAQESAREIGYEPYIGLIVSGDQFINQRLEKNKILHYHPRARACEMESTAIAQTAYVLGIPFLIIRSISDQAEGNAAIDFDKFILKAGRNSARLVEKTLGKLDFD